MVADLREMKLEAGVSELEAGRLRVGMKAVISVQAKPGQTFSGQLAAIAPEVDERNRHFKIDVRVPNDGRTLLSGMYATARIVEATTANAILLPKEAVTTRDGKRIVQKVQGDSVSVVEVVEGLRTARACRSSRASPRATPCSPTPVASSPPARRSVALLKPVSQ